MLLQCRLQLRLFENSQKPGFCTITTGILDFKTCTIDSPIGLYHDQQIRVITYERSLVKVTASQHRLIFSTHSQHLHLQFHGVLCNNKGAPSKPLVSWHHSVVKQLMSVTN